MRSGDWKLTRTDGGHELFNIAADPFEQNDLAAGRRDVVDLLDSSISDWVETLPTSYQFERSRSPQRPRARAGSDRTVRDEDGDGRVWIRLDATRSRDPDGAISGYVWKVGGKRLGVGRSPLVSLAIGSHSITLIVTDYANRRSRDRLRVSVVR